MRGQHLAVAHQAQAGGTRVGRDSVWQIDSARLDDARKWLEEIEGQWDQALGRLKAALEHE